MGGCPFALSGRNEGLWLNEWLGLGCRWQHLQQGEVLAVAAGQTGASRLDHGVHPRQEALGGGAHLYGLGPHPGDHIEEGVRGDVADGVLVLVGAVVELWEAAGHNAAVADPDHLPYVSVGEVIGRVQVYEVIARSRPQEWFLRGS